MMRRKVSWKMTRSDIPRYAKALPPLLSAAAAASACLAYLSWPDTGAYVWAVAAFSAGMTAAVLSSSLRKYGRAKIRCREEAFLRMVSGPVTGGGKPPRGKIPR